MPPCDVRELPPLLAVQPQVVAHSEGQQQGLRRAAAPARRSREAPLPEELPRIVTLG